MRLEAENETYYPRCPRFTTQTSVGHSWSWSSRENKSQTPPSRTLWFSGAGQNGRGRRANAAGRGSGLRTGWGERQLLLRGSGERRPECPELGQQPEPDVEGAEHMVSWGRRAKDHVLGGSSSCALRGDRHVSVVKQYNLLSYRSVEVGHESHGSTQDGWRVAFLSGGSGGESKSLPFLATRGYLHFLACGPFLHLHSQQGPVSLTLLPSSHLPPPGKAFHFEGLMSSGWAQPDYLPHLKVPFASNTFTGSRD